MVNQKFQSRGTILAFMLVGFFVCVCVRAFVEVSFFFLFFFLSSPC